MCGSGSRLFRHRVYLNSRTARDRVIVSNSCQESAIVSVLPCCQNTNFRLLSSDSISFIQVNKSPPQWGAADTEVKVPSGENTELKRSPCKACSRSVYSHTCCAYYQGFLPCLFLPFRFIHLHFFQNLSRFLLCWLWLTHVSCVSPQGKVGHPAGGRIPC